MSILRIFSAFLAISLLGCVQDPITEKQEAISDEALFVDAFLRLQFDYALSNGFSLVIGQKLSIDMITMGKKEADFANDLIREAKEQDEKLVEAVKDFCLKNKGKNTLGSIGTLAVNHFVLTDEQINALFSTSNGKDGWVEFYKAYPKAWGIVTLSRTGFSKDGKLAVIYMGNQSGGRAGSGRIFVFEKTNGEWIKSDYGIGPGWRS